jgi:Asp-tRNA(Asn)/Glu-tRNA(Gln) amidotransferase A subunit family amidase
MVPAALGTQTAGSIVRPASFCGVYGCKPSFGLIPRTGSLKTTDSLDTIGYFVARAEDSGAFEAVRSMGGLSNSGCGLK